MARIIKPIDELYHEAVSGSRLALGRLLTVVERGGPEADHLSELAHHDAGRAHIVGITGAPGAGKSTLTGQLVHRFVEAGRRPAVLAVDPSSPLTGGAILGDRIRMYDASDSLARPSEPGADAADDDRRPFIRSMATRGHSGGLALAVPLAVRLFDAVGFDLVIIETVGVGQVEVDVVGAADTAVVVATPGMGDAVQANKAGLLEVADIFVVNKADQPGAGDVKRDLELMLDLSHLTGHDALGDGADATYRPPIVMASALDGTGADKVMDAIDDHLAYLVDTDRRSLRRRHRIRTEVRARLQQAMMARLDAALDSDHGQAVVAKAEAAALSPTAASLAIMDDILN